MTKLAQELTAELSRGLPVWIRPPKNGPDHYCGITRSKLYLLAKEGKIRSASIRDPGQIKGTRLFHLQSILDFIESREAGSDRIDNRSGQ